MLKRMFLSKLTNWYKRLIKEKLIIIPLVRDGKPTG